MRTVADGLSCVRLLLGFTLLEQPIRVADAFDLMMISHNPIKSSMKFPGVQPQNAFNHSTRYIE